MERVAHSEGSAPLAKKSQRRASESDAGSAVSQKSGAELSGNRKAFAETSWITPGRPAAGGPRAPREHGFWVMLVVACGSGVALAPSLESVLGALLLVVASVFAASFVGKKIRKNVQLQAVAALGLGGLIFPIGVSGGASVGDSLFVATGIAGVFLSTTLTVSALLLRARRRVDSAARARAYAIALPLVSLVVAAATGQVEAFFVASSVALFSVAIAVRPPSLKKLRTLGLSVAAIQVLCALVLIHS